MSKGSPIIPVRIPDELLAEIDAVVSSYRDAEPWTRSSFIIHCVRAELAKRQRSRTWRKAKKGAQT